ncbi:MAG TPA: type II secretion system F family protein [Polyangiaceae bacterium]|nr:type II secretion system F family protein [Polyangiaceae bacterium]
MNPLELPAVASIGLGLGVLGYQLAAVPMHPSPRLGAVGIQRRRALEQSDLFRTFEPVIRQIAAWVAEVRRINLLGLGTPMRKLRDRQVEHLTQAGHHLGLTPDDYMALCLLSGAGSIALTIFLAMFDFSGPIVSVMIPLLGFGIPHAMVNEARGLRQKAVRRGLPGAIDLAAMCMAGGLDFPGALGMIVKNSADDDIVAQELGQMLTSLDLGHTRKQALQDLERRVPIEAVRNFSRALIQAEEKGNPIVEVLQVQAKISRMQRSIMAEEAASRAGVLLLVPMMMLLGCVILLLMGPFIAGGFGI